MNKIIIIAGNGKLPVEIISSLKLQNIQWAISGGLRISIGFYLNIINPDIFHKYFLFGNSFIMYKILLLFVFGFFNFWRYYLLFSGASELCKSFLSLIGINLIH